jgi:hypothetical protein
MIIFDIVKLYITYETNMENKHRVDKKLTVLKERRLLLICMTFRCIWGILTTTD